jgi:hypothetical protein
VTGVAKLLDSRTGARVVIASDDHCPPHVHAGHKAEGWIVRLWFSFDSEAVGVMNITPTEHAVRQRQLNQMLDELMVNLRDARKIWWEGKQTTCLENKRMARTEPGSWAVLNERRSGAKQVRSASYEAETGKTTVTFADGTEVVIDNGDAE